MGQHPVKQGYRFPVDLRETEASPRKIADKLGNGQEWHSLRSANSLHE